MKFKVGDVVIVNNMKEEIVSRYINVIAPIVEILDNIKFRYVLDIPNDGYAHFREEEISLTIPYINEQKLKAKLGLTDETEWGHELH